MFWRSATLGGLVWLALGTAVCSNGDETTAQSNNTPSNDSNAQETENQTTDDKEAIEIPLSEIWALDMPGTRNVRELEPEIEAAKERLKTLPMDEMEQQYMRLIKNSLIWQIGQSLKPTTDKRAETAFALSSPEPELLKAVRDVLIGETKGSISFPAGSDITTVFFSRRSNALVNFYYVERRANVIEIKYRFVPHEELYLSEHFALIPLGKLPGGMYQAKVVQGPMEQKYLDAGFEQITFGQAARFVSQSFKFEVQK
jgi:hypothetical protein